MTCVAVCDSDVLTEPPQEFDLKFHRHYPDLLGEVLDVLFACLPNNLVMEVTIAGLRDGSHAFFCVFLHAYSRKAVGWSIHRMLMLHW